MGFPGRRMRGEEFSSVLESGASREHRVCDLNEGCGVSVRPTANAGPILFPGHYGDEFDR